MSLSLMWLNPAVVTALCSSHRQNDL